MNANKTCEICSIRPIPSLQARDDAGMSRGMKYCIPCFEEAGHENSHSDNGHENFESLTVRKSSFRTKAELDAWKESIRTDIAECWICHPELNEAKKAYAPRSGTSRSGMKINVPMRADGSAKAAVVEAKLSEEDQNGRFEIKIAVAKKTGEVALTATSEQESFLLFWDARGRFLSGQVRENGKTRKVRNVAEALRLAR